MNETPTSPPGPVLPPPGWHPDPTGRHQVRYWDGARWTDHVSDDGRPTTDPVAATPTAGAGTVTPEEAAAAAPVASPAAATASPAAPLAAPPPSVPATAGGVLEPGAVWGGAVPGAGAPPTMMRNIGGLAAALTVFLWIAVAASAFAVFAFVNRALVAGDVLDFDFGDNTLRDLIDLQQRADDADGYVNIAVVLTFLGALVVFVLLLIWMWRVAKNSEVAGRVQPRFGPGWTIGGWFIPLANLVIPVLVMQDLWRGSNPETPRGDPAWRRTGGSALVGWWWAVYIVATLRFFSGGEADTESEFETLRTMDFTAAAGSVAAIVAAILLIKVVRGITARQESLFAGTAAGSE